MSNVQARVQRGVPQGGQFAQSTKAESGVGLVVSMLPTAAMQKFFGDAQRHHALVDNGYAPATVLPAMTDPRRTAGRDLWWAQAFVAAEHNSNDGGHPVLPDDYTPSARAGRDVSGRAESGRLRTYRTKWTDDGVTFRMPSRNAMNAFSREVGGTFRVPFSAFDEKSGRAIETEVLVTNHGGGAWSVKAPTLGGDSQKMVEEAVTSRLERRRPVKSAQQIGKVIDTERDLLARADERARRVGAPVAAPANKSLWVSAVGYDKASGVMFTETSNGNTYGHHVSPVVFEQVRGGASPGGAFNAFVKGSPRAQVARCDDCSNVYASANGHTCATAPTVPTPQMKPSNATARRAATSVADVFRRRFS